MAPSCQASSTFLASKICQVWKIPCPLHTLWYIVLFLAFYHFFLGDEHPIEFKFESNSTYNEKGAVEVYVKQPGGVTKHRFASLILYFCAAPTSEGGKAIRPQIIFRNQPKKPEKGTDDPVDPTIPASPLLLKEIRRYDKRVDVLYQENGWADDVTSIASLKLVIEQLAPKSNPEEKKQKKKKQKTDKKNTFVFWIIAWTPM